MPVTFDSLFLAHIAASYDKQVYLHDSLGDNHRWQFDLTEGILTFNSRLSFAAQVLGTESLESHTWMWGWANEASGIPPHLLEAALKMRALGEREHIRAFTASQMLLDGHISGYRFAVSACGVTQANCFYRAEYDGGALYLLIRDPAFRWRITDPLLRIARLFPEMVAKVGISNHLNALLHYLQFYELDWTRTDRYISARQPGTTLTAEFDAEHRLVTLSAMHA
ncbi:MAG: hypothetical protein IT326_09025 [Anaerolineae bacterium]|nr:hypothetical protein [Anaerolineae bacterium]